MGKKYCDMTPEQKQRAAETHREWLDAHPFKAREYVYRYRAKHREEYRRYQHEYYLAHKEQCLEYTRRYRAKKKAEMEAATQDASVERK